MLPSHIKSLLIDMDGVIWRADAPIGDLAATSGTSGTITGSIELTKAQVDDLAAGRLYIQLHSEKAPDGNLWGWLFAAEGKK